MSIPESRDQPLDHGSEPAANCNTVHREEAAVPREPLSTTRATVVAREEDQFAGMKFGSAFFGWLTATGTAVLLTAILAATGAVVGINSNVTSDKAANVANSNAGTVGIHAFSGAFRASRSRPCSSVQQLPPDGHRRIRSH